jgi:outer membrane protein assembly factor BamA
VDLNAFGRGRTLGLRGLYSDRESSLRLYHVVPNFLGRRTTLEAFVEGNRERIEGTLVKGWKTWLQVTFPRVRRTQHRVYALIDDREISDTDPDTPLKERVLSPFVGWQLNYDTRQRQLTASGNRGVAFTLDVAGAHEAAGSDFSVLGVFSQLRTFLPLTENVERPLTWAQSVRTSLLEPFDDELPRVDRLRLGGEYSVRGYPRESLGPLDQEGVPLGGEVLFVLNEELHFPVWRGLTGLLFFDAGNVWESRHAIDSKLFTSTGIGLRASSPVGPLRLDLAFPLDRREDDPDYRFYFGFGTVF